jgi:ribosomal protein S18 acetylase RimI-like enzyme
MTHDWWACEDSAVGGVTEASVGALHEVYDGAFVRYQLTADSVRTIWRLGDAMVVDQHRDRHGHHVAEPVLYCLGDADELGPLLRHVAQALPTRPRRVSIEAHAADALPGQWQHDHANRWDAMWTDAAPAYAADEERVETLHDDAEVDALLDRANPHTHGRPGDPGMRAWVGIRAGPELVAVGALSTVVVSGVAHLRGVSTLPDFRGRGLGTAVSARLTRMGLETMSPVVTLGVYTDNAAAISVYRRLGYHHDRSFVSGPLRVTGA